MSTKIQKAIEMFNFELMKHSLLIASLLLAVGCTQLDPTACTCGHELAKSMENQDKALMEACSQKSEKLSDEQKVKWFNEVMSCVEQ
jgi:hypothetical protein